MKNLSLFLLVSILTSCEFYEELVYKAKRINRYEKISLELARETRKLQLTVNELRFKINTLEGKNKYLAMEVEKKNSCRNDKWDSLARKKGDLVRYSVYKWDAKKLLAIAEEAFSDKKYEKAAQYYNTFVEEFAEGSKISDQILFQAGISSFRSQNHYEWTIKHFSMLEDLYPTSKYFRGAKIWKALANYKLGNYEDFFNTVEEFRLKYRNTPEWRILSNHYEEIGHKFNN